VPPELRNREHTHTCGYDFAPQRIQRGVIAYPIVQSYAFAVNQDAFTQAQGPRHRAAGHLIARTHARATSALYVLDVSGPTCVVTLDAQTLVGNTDLVIRAAVTAQPARQELDSITGTILEMRPARRLPGEKPEEELSEFEREYPW
jgi:hypothetical protein